MQILSTRQTRQNSGAVRGQAKPQPGNEEAAERGGILDTFRPKYDKLNVHLDSPEYQNVKDLEAANMLGHFTQTMQNNGYPWRMHAAETLADGSFKKSETVSDLEALQRLKKGEPVLMQPMRDLPLPVRSPAPIWPVCPKSPTIRPSPKFPPVARGCPSSSVSRWWWKISLN